MGKVIKRQIRSDNAAGGLEEVELRPLQESDIEQIISIAKDSFDKVWSFKDFSYFITHESGYCRGMLFQNQLVGYFLGLLVCHELDIVSVAVAKKWRRRGAAETLVRHVCENEDVKVSFLEVESDNGAAIALYEKCGFQKYGLRRKYYDGKKDATLMKKI